MDILLQLIIIGFMCISSGFCTYGCYRCFTDRDGNRVGSEYEHSRKTHSNESKSKKRVQSPSLSSFNGTIYTVSSEDSASNEHFLEQKMLKDSHDYALSLNPNLVRWTINANGPNGVQKADKNSRRTKTAPM